MLITSTCAHVALCADLLCTPGWARCTAGQCAVAKRNSGSGLNIIMINYHTFPASARSPTQNPSDQWQVSKRSSSTTQYQQNTTHSIAITCSGAQYPGSDCSTRELISRAREASHVAQGHHNQYKPTFDSARYVGQEATLAPEAGPWPPQHGPPLPKTESFPEAPCWG